MKDGRTVPTKVVSVFWGQLIGSLWGGGGTRGTWPIPACEEDVILVQGLPMKLMTPHKSGSALHANLAQTNILLNVFVACAILQVVDLAI